MVQSNLKEIKDTRTNLIYFKYRPKSCYLEYFVFQAKIISKNELIKLIVYFCGNSFFILFIIYFRMFQNFVTHHVTGTRSTT